MASTPRRFWYYQNRPTISAIVRYGYNQIRINALLDSGADYSVLGRTEATSLGIDWEQGKVLSIENADGSRFRGREFTLEMEIAEHRFPARIIFSEQPVVETLIGRADVFDRFAINFRQSEGFVELVPNIERTS